MGDTLEQIIESQESSVVATNNQTAAMETPVLDSDEGKRSTDEPRVVDQSIKQDDNEVIVNKSEVIQSQNDEANEQSDRADSSNKVDSVKSNDEGCTQNTEDSNTESHEDITEIVEASNTESHDEAAPNQNDAESSNNTDTPKTDENPQIPSDNAENKNIGSLKMLCQYGGDSSSDDDDDKDGDGAMETEVNGKNPTVVVGSDKVEAKEMLDSVMKSTDAYRIVDSDE